MRWATATQPAYPILDGATFGGWYTDEELTIPFFFDTPITTNTTLYTGWNVTVTFDTCGGSTIAPQTVLIGSKATQPENPTKPNLTFGGWYRDKELLTLFVFDTETITDNTIIYARWKATVTFDTNGGSAVANQTIKEGANATQPENDPTKAGYTFLGWYKDERLTIPFTFETAITTNTTLYARWNAFNHFTVTFNTNGGTAIAPQTVPRGSKATQPENPTKPKYAFGRWYTDSVRTKAKDFATPITKDTTLYAGWRSTWSTVAAGWKHTVGIKEDGSLFAWGKNDKGQLGNGKSGGNETSPTLVIW